MEIMHFYAIVLYSDRVICFYKHHFSLVGLYLFHLKLNQTTLKLGFLAAPKDRNASTESGIIFLIDGDSIYFEIIKQE
jgi:hypothetical protein